MSVTQAGLNFKISQRTVLVDLQSVRAAFGLDAESVLAMVDAGELKWVFNIALGDDIRELRFLASEIVDAAKAPRTLTTAVETIVGSGDTITRGELERQWVCSHVHIMRLIREQEIALLTPSKISRRSLRDFLTRRWCGAVGARSTAPVKARNVSDAVERVPTKKGELV